ncbi:DUF2158 domain-containing protein [Endozoicomonas sp.]|uniref:DUF2158 domain-containing protein n=1 Tax=Endozoicomonas sp. TaxID=1892382 RepID=UPI003AF76C27
MSNSHNFKIGDVVSLNTCEGPYMTVSEFKMTNAEENYLLYCQWFINNNLITEEFDARVLITRKEREEREERESQAINEKLQVYKEYDVFDD